MARGYELHEEDERSMYVPSRPARRADSRKAGETAMDGGEGGGRQGSGTGRFSSTKQESYAGGHYAESPIMIPPGERTLAIVPSSSSPHHAPAPIPAQRRGRMSSTHGGGGGSTRRSATLPAASGAGSERRSRSAASRYPPPPPGSSGRLPNGGTVATVSKVTRSRSLSSRPAGIAMYHPPGRASVADAHERIPTEAYAVQNRPSSRATRISSKSGKSHGTTAVSTATGRNTTKAGVVVETMSAPNPFCPNTRGVCCLMVLVNLALILVAIGFIIVLQLHDPPFVWNLGIVILVCGFVTFFVVLVYCMCICQESQHYRPGHPASGELYWTHHWQKNITIPEIRTRDKERWDEQDRFPEDENNAGGGGGAVVADVGELSDTSSRDYPRLYLESDYGQRTDREADFETDGGGSKPPGAGAGDRYSSAGGGRGDGHGKGRL